MKSTYLTIMIVLSVLLLSLILATMIQCKKHPGRVSSGLRLVLLFMTFPLGGNFMALLAGNETIARSGYTILLLGSGLLCFNMVAFTMDYCEFKFRNTPLQFFIVSLFALNSISTCLNFYFHHIFDVKEVTLENGDIFYSFQPFWGGHIGFIIIELFLSIMVMALVIKCTRISSTYYEKYVLLIVTVVICSMFEAYSQFTDTPVNLKLIGYLIFDIMSFYLTFFHKPIFIRSMLTNGVVENHNDGIIFYDSNADALYANNQAYNILELENGNPDKCTDRLIEILGGADINADFEIPARFKDELGNVRYLIINHRLMKDNRNLCIGSFFSVHDNTSEVRLDERRRYMATHDEVTGLYNRNRFAEEVEALRKKKPETPFNMIVSDINDFKLINDIFGRDSADRILKNIAQTIEDIAPKGSVYCRWRGDIFACFTRKEDVDLEKLENMLRNLPFKDERIKQPLIVHVGVYEVEPGEQIEPAAMVDRTALAIGSIKNDLNHLVAVYDDKLRADKIWAQRITSELPTAIAEGQIIPYIQPQYNSKGILEGGEILARWNHPTEGLLSPGRFMPVFEKNGMIASIDLHMWESACAILARWAKEGNGRENLCLSVNISPKDFYFMNIYEEITRLVQKYQIDPSKLHLEITESAIMGNITENFKIITALRRHGFTFEMDDFGSGYSSLNMLKDMPVDVLKLDMVFLGKTTDFAKSKIILSSIVNMANDLNMHPISEGIETKEQLDMMLEMGCTLFQGYYFSKPIPVTDFEKLPLIWKD